MLRRLKDWFSEPDYRLLVQKVDDQIEAAEHRRAIFLASYTDEMTPRELVILWEETKP